MSFDRKSHWETIYQTKTPNEVSWFQPNPETSLQFFRYFNVPKTAKIIDIGGGDSFLVDHLLDLGFNDITVLDISETAINRAKQRLGKRSKLVNWIVSDVTSFNFTEIYDFWHDRATFHFLTEERDISIYLKTANDHLSSTAFLVIGTFSKEGPRSCSGIDIKQYSEITLEKKFNRVFKKVKCITVNHTTPFKTIQNFVFCGFRKQ